MSDKLQFVAQSDKLKSLLQNSAVKERSSAFLKSGTTNPSFTACVPV